MKVLDIRIFSGVFLLMPLSQILYTIQILEYPIAILLVLDYPHKISANPTTFVFFIQKTIKRPASLIAIILTEISNASVIKTLHWNSN